MAATRAATYEAAVSTVTLARKFKVGYSPSGWDELSRHLQQGEVLARRHHWCEPRVRQPCQQAARRVPRSADVPDLGQPRRSGRVRCARLARCQRCRPAAEVQEHPETPIYRKSTLLYGLNWAKGEIVARGEVVICEGYTDVMAFHLAGVTNAVATCGTALADEHFVALKNLARKITLAYDADAAGQAAAERCYQWEQRFEVSVPGRRSSGGPRPRRSRGTTIRAGSTKAVEGATPFLQFRLDRALAGADLSTIEGKARAANAAIAIIAEHPERLRARPVRDACRRSTLRTDNVPRLRDEVAKVRRGAKPSIGASRPSGGAERGTAPTDLRSA